MEIHIDLVQALFGVVVLIVWLARLEFISNQSRKDIETLWGKHEALEKNIVEKLSIIEKSLAKIEGKLSIEQ